MFCVYHHLLFVSLPTWNFEQFENASFVPKFHTWFIVYQEHTNEVCCQGKKKSCLVELVLSAYMIVCSICCMIIERRNNVFFAKYTGSFSIQFWGRKLNKTSFDYSFVICVCYRWMLGEGGVRKTWRCAVTVTDEDERLWLMCAVLNCVQCDHKGWLSSHEWLTHADDLVFRWINYILL